MCAETDKARGYSHSSAKMASSLKRAQTTIDRISLFFSLFSYVHFQKILLCSSGAHQRAVSKKKVFFFFNGRSFAVTHRVTTRWTGEGGHLRRLKESCNNNNVKEIPSASKENKNKIDNHHHKGKPEIPLSESVTAISLNFCLLLLLLPLNSQKFLCPSISACYTKLSPVTRRTRRGRFADRKWLGTLHALAIARVFCPSPFVTDLLCRSIVKRRRRRDQIKEQGRVTKNGGAKQKCDPNKFCDEKNGGNCWKCLLYNKSHHPRVGASCQVCIWRIWSPPNATVA